MKKSLAALTTAAMVCTALGLMAVPAANAQSGGGGANSGGVNSGGGGGGSLGGGGLGGGGAARHGGSYNLLFDNTNAINGITPACSGIYGLTTYITTLSLKIKITSCNLPDGSVLTVTAYAKDYYNGTPWAPKVAGTITIVGHSGSFAAASVWTTPAGGLPTLTSVDITAPDGSLIASGHP